ncbi:TnsA endonuclease N-terminal domain-containing protein [Methylovirgula sp. HY1]|uniref:TnsA endonuclease N-terminal domain-containing protein n=1 Tax=Methylovirgula sp. HY1 TaxID=2822761 RepID=UPI001C5B4C6B|nr:TnsA endonuclease N-terminal domain-containing protein [Methylovirgula sp. HY1]QXX74594.1 Transposon Tn7 transposition protein TnsA [Methylovirgula sp. HY1]
MGKRRYGFCERRIARFAAERRGQGIGPGYRPWLTVSDLPSHGRSHRTFCPKTGRSHHLLSDGEHYAFHLLWWDEDVIDIREQFPLSRIETLAIAAQLNIRHPRDIASSAPLVQTTDFLVTRCRGAMQFLEAISVKPDDQLSLGRTLDKLEIERQYWLRRTVPWRLLPHSAVKTVFARNLVWILGGGGPRRDGDLVGQSAVLSQEFLTYLANMGNVPIRAACLAFDANRGFAAGTALGILRTLLAEKRVTTDLHQYNLQDRPCAAFNAVHVP